MGSKGRVPPPHLRRPLPGPAMGLHPEPFGAPIRPPPGAYPPPFDMMLPPEIMEQKLAAQHVEMQKLATENHRFAATHGTLRQDLAGSQHELQMLHAQITAVKSDADQQVRSMTEKIAKMESDLKAAEPLKSELQQARTEAQSLVASRQELITKVQLLSTDLHRARGDVQQIPALMAEFDGLRQEYQHCRATYDYEKKLYNDHLESLQLMEKNYINMAREVEKLRGELMNPAYADRRPVAPYGVSHGSNENEASGQPVGHNVYEDGYNSLQGRGPPPPNSAGASAPIATGTPTYAGSQSGGPVPARHGYDASRGPGYDPAGVLAFDPQRVHGYDPQRGPGYDPQLHRGGTGYDPQRAGYDVQRGPGYEVQRGGPGYDPLKAGSGFDAQPRGAAGPPHGHVTPNAPYGSATPPQPARGVAGNLVRR